MPDYAVRYEDETDHLVFTRRRPAIEVIPNWVSEIGLDPDTYHEAREAAPGWARMAGPFGQGAAAQAGFRVHPLLRQTLRERGAALTTRTTTCPVPNRRPKADPLDSLGPDAMRRVWMIGVELSMEIRVWAEPGKGGREIAGATVLSAHAASGFLLRSMALMMTRSWRATAMRIVFGALPFSCIRSRMATRLGTRREAVRAAM